MSDAIEVKIRSWVSFDSHRDAFAAYVEYLGFLVDALPVGVTCKRVWRSAWTDDEGEEYPGHWEYEVRCGRRRWTFDDNIGQMFLAGDEREKAAIAELVRRELEAVPQ